MEPIARSCFDRSEVVRSIPRARPTGGRVDLVVRGNVGARVLGMKRSRVQLIRASIRDDQVVVEVRVKAPVKDRTSDHLDRDT